MTRKLITFLLITFATSWSLSAAAWALELEKRYELNIAVLEILIMFCPAFGAVICALLFEPAGTRKLALGLLWRPSWWWLVAWLGAISIGALSVLFTVLLSNYKFVIDAALFLACILLCSIIGSLLFTLSEELGWRGYLYHL
jgi:uncharacterized protein